MPIPTLSRETMLTRADTQTIAADVVAKMNPAQRAANTFQGVGSFMKEQKDTSDGKRTDGKRGSPGEDAKLAPTGRKERIAQAKFQSGFMVDYAYYPEQGHFALTNNGAQKLPELASFLDTYRSDPNRAFVEKSQYPIANIQVVRRNANAKRSNLLSRIIMPQNTRFFLTQVSMSSRDKVQMVKTFKSFRLFTYDGDPQVWSFQGILMNTENHNWLTEFRAVYAQYLAPSQCAKNNAEVVIQFQDFYLSGLILETGSTLMAAQDGGVPFQFNMLLTAEMSLATTSVLNKTVRYISANAGRRVSGLTASLVYEDFARSYGKFEEERRAGIRALTPKRMNKLDPEAKKALEALLQDPAFQQSGGGL